jgi:hypothetical protein
MPKKTNPHLRKAIMEIIDNQIREETPPETAATLARLISAGYSKEEAMEMLGAVVVSEIFDILKQGRTYDEDRYIAALHALPQLPWDESKKN